jgi:hypothetical protein
LPKSIKTVPLTPLQLYRLQGQNHRPLNNRALIAHAVAPIRIRPRSPIQ